MKFVRPGGKLDSFKHQKTKEMDSVRKTLAFARNDTAFYHTALHAICVQTIIFVHASQKISLDFNKTRMRCDSNWVYGAPLCIVRF
jgi:hypothetical protein